MSKQKIYQGVLEQPFHKACGLELISTENGHAQIRFATNDFTLNPQGALHGGILYAMMDVACFLALLPCLPEDRHPVSVDVHTSVISAARSGDQVIIRSHVDRVGRSLAFMHAEAYAVNGQAEKLIATGNVTKAILSVS
jgi:uncharacterized protein (TIGR00369 family)